MEQPKSPPFGNRYDPARLELILVDHADTLVYVDSPPLTSSWSTLPRTTESIPHRISSETLWASRSEYFARLLHPRNQARTIKRRGLEGKLDGGIKYVLDLTPPSLEDDAIIFLTELSCPRGIRVWSCYQKRFDLPTRCVGGRDELEQGSKSANFPASTHALPVEYSASRHRMAIYWLLRSFESWTPPLDTPCKFWTYFTLAKLFNVTMVPRVRQTVFNWINERNNPLLIEVSPESTYRVACAMQDLDLLRDSFSVLVGEEVLLLLANSDNTTERKPSQYSFHGRLREGLDDEELQRIEYASKNFMEHVIHIFLYLAGTEMAWLYKLPSVRSILNYTPKSEDECRIVSRLITTLKICIRNHIVTVLQLDSLTWFPEAGLVKAAQGNIHQLNHPQGQGHPMDQEYPSEKSLHAYYEMRLLERLASRTFWNNLTHHPLIYNPSTPLNNLSNSRNLTSIASIAPHLPAFQSQHEAVITPIKWNELAQAAENFNALTGTTNSDSPNPILGVLPPSNTTTFCLWEFVGQARGTMKTYSTQLAEPSESALHCRITDTLTTLTDNEYKFLPLWAGGNDDGTGGVYAGPDIPFLETGGFSTAGPAIHTGGSSARSLDSSVSMIDVREAESTVAGASHRPTDGLGSEVVSVSASEVGGGGSELGSDHWMVDDDDDDDNDIDVDDNDDVNDNDDDDDDTAGSDSDDTVVLSLPGDDRGGADHHH